MKQTFVVIKDVNGVDMADVMRSGTINVKNDKNIQINGLPQVPGVGLD